MKKKMALEMQRISQDNFKKYGTVVSVALAAPDLKTENIRQWCGVAETDGFQGIPYLSLLEVKKVPICCSQLESVVNSAEAYLSLGFSDYVIFVADPLNTDEPDESTMQAFLVPKDVSIVLNQGVWHWSPFPIDRNNLFYLIISKKVYHIDQRVTINMDEVIFWELEINYLVISSR